jgi:RIO kinase 1
MAIKIYKTSIPVFKDRDRYVMGDSWFSRYSKHNPRKMVKMWAEKEMRNLKRAVRGGDTVSGTDLFEVTCSCHVVSGR